MNIAIRGAGHFGRYVAQQLVQRKNDVVKFYVDNNIDICGSVIDGIQVISPEQLYNKYDKEIDVVLVAFMDSITFFNSIVTLDKKIGFIGNRVFEAKMSLSDDLLQDKNIVWNDASYLNKPILRSLETNIVDNCNLNCKGCSHFSNLFEHGAQIPYEIFCKDLKQVTEHVFVHQFNMLGGEALLNDKITEYIEYARKLLPYSEIQLISNGLLIPTQSDDFFKCCKENDITISISGYKPTLQIKDKIVDILDKYHIVYIFREDVSEFSKNIDLTGKSDKDEAVRRCHQNKCHFLRNGKIYKCPFEALGNIFFEHFGVNINFEGGTNIYDERLDWEKLIDGLYNMPVDACKYCSKEEKIVWKVEHNPVIEDWIV